MGSNTTDGITKKITKKHCQLKKSKSNTACISKHIYSNISYSPVFFRDPVGGCTVWLLLALDHYTHNLQTSLCQQSLSYRHSPTNFFLVNFNIDGQQFYQYLQNERSTLTLSHWTLNRPQHMLFEITALAWDRHKNVARLNQLIE